jgi:signal transduction histidine kinase
MREREPRLTKVDLDALLGGVLLTTPPPPGVKVSLDASANFEADPSLLAQVLTNLITNAYQAMPEGGSLHVSASSDGGATLISVRDSGSGFDPKVANRLFDPFFTTKDDGTGLGLAIVQRLVEVHSGSVSIHNVTTGGAEVVVRIPHRESK